MRTAGESEARDPFELLRHTEVRAVLIVSGVISMAWDLQSFMIPVYGTSIGLTASQIGLVLGSFAAATFVIRLAMPALSRRYHEWQVLLFTLLASAVAFGLMPLFNSMAPLMAVAFLLGLGLGSAQPNVMSLLHERAPTGPRRRSARPAHDDHEQQSRRAAAGDRRLRLGARRGAPASG